MRSILYDIFTFLSIGLALNGTKHYIVILHKYTYASLFDVFTIQLNKMNIPTYQQQLFPEPIPLDGSADNNNYDSATEQKQTQDAGQLLMPLNPSLSINSDNDINNTTMSPTANNTNLCDNDNGGESNFYSNVYQQIDCFSTNMTHELQELEQLLGADVLELLNDPNDYDEDIDDSVSKDGQVDSSENNNVDGCDASMRRLSIAGHGPLTEESVAKVHAVSSYVKELLKDDSYRSNNSNDELVDILEDTDKEKDSGDEEDRKQSQSPTTPSSAEDKNVLLNVEYNKKVHDEIEQPILTEIQSLVYEDVKKDMDRAVLNGKDKKVDCDDASSQLVKLAESQSTKSIDDKEAADSEGLNDTPVAEDEDVVSTNDEEDAVSTIDDRKEKEDLVLDGEVESSEQPSELTEQLKAKPVALDSKKENKINERKPPTPVTEPSSVGDETDVSHREVKEGDINDDKDMNEEEGVNGIGLSVDKPETSVKKQTTAKQIDMTWNKSPVTTKTTKQPTEGAGSDRKEAKQNKGNSHSQKDELEKSTKQQTSKLIDMTRNVQRRSPKPPKKQSAKMIDMTRNVNKTPRSDASPTAASVKKRNSDECADKTIVESSNSESADISTKKEPKLIDMKRNGGRNTPNKLTNNNKKKRQEREKAAQEAPPKQPPTVKKIDPSQTKPQDDFKHAPPTSEGNGGSQTVKPQAAKLIDMKPRRKVESRQKNNDESKSNSSGEKSQSKKAPSQQRPSTNGQQGRGSNYSTPVNGTSGRGPFDRRREQVPNSMQIETTKISTSKKETLTNALARPNRSPIISEKSPIRSARDSNRSSKRGESRSVIRDPSKIPKPPERKQIMDPRRNNTGRQKTNNRVDNESASSKLTYQLSARQKKQIQESLDRAKRNFLLSL